GAVHVAHHERVEPRAGHHREPFAVDDAGIDATPRAAQPDADRRRDLSGNPQVGRQQVGRPGRHDRKVDLLRSGQRVNATLDHPVAAPHEDQARALLHGPPHRLRRRPTRRHLVPERVGVSGPGQPAAQLTEPAIQGLAGVRNDRQSLLSHPSNLVPVGYDVAPMLLRRAYLAFLVASLSTALAGPGCSSSGPDAGGSGGATGGQGTGGASTGGAPATGGSTGGTGTGGTGTGGTVGTGGAAGQRGTGGVGGAGTGGAAGQRGTGGAGGAGTGGAAGRNGTGGAGTGVAAGQRGTGGAPSGQGSAAKSICASGATYGNPLTGMGSVSSIAAPASDYFAFIEGPVWIGGLSTLFFSDNASSPSERIFKLLPPSTTPALFLGTSGSNGLGVDNSDRIIAADQRNKRIVRFDPMTGQVVGTPVSTGSAKPNDVIVRSDDNVYFTDPDSGFYRISPTGTVSAAMKLTSSSRPNGIELSLDENTLYVGDVGNRTIAKYTLAD